MKNIPNKAITNNDLAEQDFHFAGAGVHNPITIRAKSVAEAEAKLAEIIQSKSPPLGTYEVEEKVDVEEKVLSKEN